jgi:putative aminopeptidase FrvX
MEALAIAEGLLAQPTVPYHEHLAAEHCLAFARDHGIAAGRDAAGNVLLRVETPGADLDHPLVLVAHLDHPGFVIDTVEEDRVSLTFHGGLGAENALEGAPIHFFRAGEREPSGTGTLVAAEEKGGRLTGATAAVLDGGATPGGIALWGFPAWSVANGRITARVCDDLLGAAAILACLREIADAGPPGVAVSGLLTRAEEVGFLGAIEAIRLGTVPTGAHVLSLECSKALTDAPQGGGVIVRVGDRMSVFAPSLTESVRTAAARVAEVDPAFRFQRKLMDGGACEATAFCASGYRASGIAVPLGNYHNAADDGPGIAPETVLVDDWLAEVRLLVELANDPALLVDDAAGAPPPWFQERAAQARAALGAA